MEISDDGNDGDDGDDGDYEVVCPNKYLLGSSI